MLARRSLLESRASQESLRGVAAVTPDGLLVIRSMRYPAAKAGAGSGGSHVSSAGLRNLTKKACHVFFSKPVAAEVYREIDPPFLRHTNYRE